MKHNKKGLIFFFLSLGFTLALLLSCTQKAKEFLYPTYNRCSTAQNLTQHAFKTVYDGSIVQLNPEACRDKRALSTVFIYNRAIGSMCTGFILDETSIGTASHCVVDTEYNDTYNNPQSDIHARYKIEYPDGSIGIVGRYPVINPNGQGYEVYFEQDLHNFFLGNGTALNKVRAYVTKVLVHEDALLAAVVQKDGSFKNVNNTKTPWHDIAILKLRDNNASDFGFLPVKIYEGEVNIGTKTTSIGFGLAYFPHYRTYNLRQAETEIIEIDRSDLSFNVRARSPDSYNHFKEICSGDSGGPTYIYDDDSDEYQVIAVTSRSNGLCGSGDDVSNESLTLEDKDSGDKTNADWMNRCKDDAQCGNTRRYGIEIGLHSNNPQKPKHFSKFTESLLKSRRPVLSN